MGGSMTKMLCGLLIGLPMTSAAWSAPANGTSFFDDFDTLDTGFWYISDGWSNGDHQNCGWSSKEVSIADGTLRLGFSKTPAADNRIYRCGEIQSNATYGYGTYEARLKTPAGSGLNASFFTYIGPPTGTIHDEIDFEVLLKDTSKIQTGGYVSGQGVDVALPILPQPADEAFTDLAFVWNSTEVRYYVDGKLVHTVAAPAAIQSNPQKIFFSLWGSDTQTEWLGPMLEPEGPIAMQVDWVGYTAPGQSCLFPSSITC